MAQPAAADRFERVLVIVTRQIGDVLLTLPVLTEVRRLWPAARIDVLGFAGTLAVLKGHPALGELIEVPAGSGWRASWPLMQRLWRRYDLALIGETSDRAHLYGFIAARTRSGLVLPGRQSWWKRRLLRHAALPATPRGHTVLEKLSLLAPWRRATDAGTGIAIDPAPGAPLPAALADRIEAPYLVMHAPSLVRFKQWSPARYAAVARAVAERGVQVLLTGSPSPQDREVAAAVAALAGHRAVLDLSGRLDLSQTRTLLGGAAAYVGPDTSVTHLAAACGIATVAIFGPTDPGMWGPWPAGWPERAPYARHALLQQRGNVTLLQGEHSCVPCGRGGCENRRDSVSLCLERLPAERVLQAVLGALGEAGARA